MSFPASAFHPAPPQHEALWLSPDGGTGLAAFNLMWSVRIEGPLDPAALQAALTRVIARHDGLRAVFRWADDRLEWRILPPGPVALDLDAPPPDDAAAAARDTAFGTLPYDLGQGPLYRFRLTPQTDGSHRLLCAFHHLVFDGTSWPIFVSDLAAILAGSDLPPAPQASDEARAQALWLSSAEGARARTAARDHVARQGSDWTLPSPPPGPPQIARRIRSRNIDLPGPLSDRLRRRAAAFGTTPFRLGMAVFMAFLSRLSRREDVAVMTTLTGRDGPSGGTIGFLVNRTPIIARIDPTLSVAGLARLVHDQIDSAIPHQRLPLRLANRSNDPSKPRAQSALTEVLFTRRPESRTLTAGPLVLTDAWEELPLSDKALAVHVQDRGDCIRLTWRWREDALMSPTIGPLANQFRVLLSEALAQPHEPIAALSSLPPVDRDRILGPLNATDQPFARAAPLHQMVAEQATATPDASAIVAGDTAMTYAEVMLAARRLAARLDAAGVGPGPGQSRFVPILMHPSPQMVVAELAVLMAGAAFVPLSPDWPPERIAALRAQVGTAPLLVTGPADPGMLSVAEAMAADPEGGPDRGPDAGPDGRGIMGTLDDPIYAMFTSGSTGAPKLAVNLHRGIVNRLLAMDHAFGPAGAGTVLATAPGTVDTHVWQFFWPLISGGTVVIPPRTQAVSAPDLCRLIHDHAVTVADFVPSIFARLVTHASMAGPGALDSLRLVLIGGEAMRPADAHAFRRLLPQVTLVNTYGPTETSIAALFHILTGEEAPVPIGRPFANIRAVVMAGDRLAPLGQVGELCLGGACLGQGYLNDPEATARAFIPNPFPELGGDRLYRTGDLARMRPDGIIDYLGRADHQIKIRGQRIEPAEVEAAILRLSGVEAALVRAQGERLEALVVPRGGAELSLRGLRDRLMSWLPAHMVPSDVLIVPALPLAAGGKIDRTAAQTLSGTPLTDAARRADPPQTAAEQQMAAIWARELGRAEINRHDDIFRDLGADSLAALRVVLAAEALAGHEVGLSTLFHAPTLAAFAARLDAVRTLPPERLSLLDRQRDHLRTWTGERLAEEGFLFVKNPTGQRHPLFWCCQGHAELAALSLHLGMDRPVIGMRSGHLIMDYTPDNITHLAETYAAEMAALQPDGPFILGGNCQAATIMRAAAEALRGMGRAVALLVLLEETNFTPCPDPAVLLFGKDSHLNPFGKGDDPTAAIRAAFGPGVKVDFVPGEHGKLFTPALGQTIAAILDGAEPSPPAALRLGVTPRTASAA